MNYSTASPCCIRSYAGVIYCDKVKIVKTIAGIRGRLKSRSRHMLRARKVIFALAYLSVDALRVVRMVELAKRFFQRLDSRFGSPVFLGRFQEA
jgi:hypothetical protein